MRVHDVLTLHGRYFGMRAPDASRRADELLDVFDLETKAKSLPSTLSGGMRRRLMLARALVHEPALVILDEPTAGVDVELRQGLWQFIRRLNGDGHTIVLTTHYLEEAEALCGRIAMLRAGRVVALDSTRNLLNRFQTHVHLRVRLSGRALPPELAGLVHHADDRGHVLKLKTFDEVESRLAALRAAGCCVEEMEVTQPDLEEVFVEIMQRESAAEKTAAA